MRAGFVVFKGKRKNNNSNSVDCKGLKRLIAVTAGVVAVILTAVFSQAFFSGWLDLCRSGFFFLNEKILKISAAVALCALDAATVFFLLKGKFVLFRTGLLSLIIVMLCSLTVYFLKKSGALEKISDAKQLTEYIRSFGALSAIMLFAVEFFAVLFLPVPDIIPVTAGAVLYGPFFGGLICFCGVYLGSVTAFFAGRKFGNKAAGFLVGKDNLEKGLKAVRGKDKAVLSLMLIFPFFPDDLLCLVSGLSSMSAKYFLTVAFFARGLSCFFSAYAVSGALIPFDKTWGIAVWAVIFVLSVFLCKIVISDKNTKRNAARESGRFFKIIKKR